LKLILLSLALQFSKLKGQHALPEMLKNFF